MTIGHLATLMSFAMTAVRSFHRFDSSRGSSLLYQSHISLTHYQIACHPAPIEVIPFCESLVADFQKYLDSQQQLQLVKSE